jgi:hypothetical protein
VFHIAVDPHEPRLSTGSLAELLDRRCAELFVGLFAVDSEQEAGPVAAGDVAVDAWSGLALAV